MSSGPDERVKQVLERVEGIVKMERERIDDEFSGLPYGMGRATDEEFALLFEERVNGRVARDQFGQIVFDELGAPVFETSPDPLFTQALIATREGKPIVRGGEALLKRYERIRGIGSA